MAGRLHGRGSFPGLELDLEAVFHGVVATPRPIVTAVDSYARGCRKRAQLPANP